MASGRSSWFLAALACALIPLAGARTYAADRIDHDCLINHITDASHLNERRRPIYATWAHRIGLSWADSVSVSTIFIGSELFSRHDSKSIDRQAREFQDQGIRIVCDDLRPISNAGPDPICPKNGDSCFIPKTGTRVPRKPLPPMEVPDAVKSKPQQGWTAKIKTAYDQDIAKTQGTTFPATLETARGILKEMNDYPRFFCIGRHLVESLVRIAALAPRYEASRIEKGLANSTLPISRHLIESHITLLGTTGSAFGLDGLDTRAAILQSKGIPLICNDVPPIPDPDRS